MEYTNENFTIKYNKYEDVVKLETTKKSNKLLKFIKSHKFISSIIISLIVFIIMNILLITTFILTLGKL